MGENINYKRTITALTLAGLTAGLTLSSAYATQIPNSEPPAQVRSEISVKETIAIIKQKIVEKNDTFPVRYRNERGQIIAATGFRADAYSPSIKRRILLKYIPNLNGSELLFVQFDHPKYGLREVSPIESRFLDIQIVEGGIGNLIDGVPDNVNLEETVQRSLRGDGKPPFEIFTRTQPFREYFSNPVVRRQIDTEYPIVLKESAQFLTK